MNLTPRCANTNCERRIRVFEVFCADCQPQEIYGTELHGSGEMPEIEFRFYERWEAAR